MGIAELDHRRHREMADNLYNRRRRELIGECEKCDGTGNISHEEWVDDIPVPRSETCVCKAALIFEMGMHDAGLPREFWGAESIIPEFNRRAFDELAKYARNLDRVRAHGLGLVLTGRNGSGKSSSACLPLITAIRSGVTASFVNFPDLVGGWRRSWRDAELATHLDERLHRDLVVLDEVGKEHVGTDDTFVASKIDSLLRLRRGSMLPTIITTNLTIPELIKRYGESVGSLLADRYKVISYKPGDFRVKMASTWDALIEGGDADE